MYQFTIMGNPVAKGRPKFARRGAFMSAYTPEKTVNYENLVKHAFLEKYESNPIEDPLIVEILAYFPVPLSWPKSRKSVLTSGMLIPVVKKPDVDNLQKIILDALNQLAYKDDSQVFCITCKKYYSETSRVEVHIVKYTGYF